MIELQNIRKTYDKKTKHPVEALRGVSTVFPDTGMVFIVGKSGGGKSTLLNVLGGLDTYDDGDFLIDGVSTKNFSAANWDSYRNHYVGFVFQDHHLMPEYTVRENIGFALALQHEKEDNAKIEAALKIVDLEGYGERNIKKLSGGQRQRVAIARALVKEYHMILADEPTGNLDKNTAQEIFLLLKEISKTKLIIVVTHDVDAANAYADMAIRIRGGKIVDKAVTPAFETYMQQQIQNAETRKLESAQQQSRQDEPNGLPNNALEYADVRKKKITEENQVNDAEYAPSPLIPNEKHPDKVTPTIALLSEANLPKRGLQFITSRLSPKATWRIIGKSFKKRIMRLIFSVLLCIIAFSLLTSAFEYFTWNMQDTQMRLLNHEQDLFLQKVEEEKANVNDLVFLGFDNTDIQNLEKEFPQEPFYSVYEGISISNNFTRNLTETERVYYNGRATGLCIIDEAGMQSLNFALLAGEYPNESWRDNDIALPEYIYEIFQLCGYRFDDTTAQTIQTYQDLIGKEIPCFLYTDENNRDKKNFMVRGIIDTRVEPIYDDVKAFALGKGIEPNQSKTAATKIYLSGNYLVNRHTLFYANKGAYPLQNRTCLLHKTVAKENKKLARTVLDSKQYRFGDYYSDVIRQHKSSRNLYLVVSYMVGFIVSVFAIYLLASFIIACIHESKTEIGILRCVGASKWDIVKIFILEVALVSALIFSFVLLAFGLVAIPILTNIQYEAITLPVLLHTVNVANVSFLAGFILTVSSFACFIPLSFFLKKTPVQILTE